MEEKKNEKNEPLPYELDAMHGKDMPDGLAHYDQMCYLALESLYGLYRAGKITKENAAERKRQIIYSRDIIIKHEKNQDRLAVAIGKTYIRVEQLVTKYREQRKALQGSVSMDSLASLIKTMDDIIETLYPTIPSVKMEDIVTERTDKHE